MVGLSSSKESGPTGLIGCITDLVAVAGFSSGEESGWVICIAFLAVVGLAVARLRDSERGIIICISLGQFFEVLSGGNLSCFDVLWEWLPLDKRGCDGSGEGGGGESDQREGEEVLASHFEECI